MLGRDRRWRCVGCHRPTLTYGRPPLVWRNWIDQELTVGTSQRNGKKTNSPLRRIQPARSRKCIRLIF